MAVISTAAVGLQLIFIIVAGFAPQTSAFRLYSLPQARQSNESGAASVSEDIEDVILAPLMDLEEQVAVGNTTERCHLVMVQLAVFGSNFTHCLITHSRPFRACEKCVKHYTRFNTLFHDLQGDVQCRRMLLMSDSLQFINNVHQVFTSSWSTAHCNACFDYIDQNSTTGHVTFNLTADAVYFMKLEAKVSSCFSNYTHVIDHGNASEACHACKESYLKLNKNFHVLKTHSHDHICMDLRDMMNTTWLKWSTDFNCSVPVVYSSIVMAISIIATVVTILLYPVTKIVYSIRAILIVEQKRMKSSRHKSRYGATSVIEEVVNEDTPSFIAAAHVQGAARRPNRKNNID